MEIPLRLVVLLAIRDKEPKPVQVEHGSFSLWHNLPVWKMVARFQPNQRAQLSLFPAQLTILDL